MLAHLKYSASSESYLLSVHWFLARLLAKGVFFGLP